MPDVRLPDGTIVKNVPEGMGKGTLLAKLAANGMNVPKEWYPAAPVDNSASARGRTALGALTAGALDIAGLPMTTLNNAANLVKAAIGTPYTAITGDAPAALQPVDNADMIGTGEWLKRQMAESGAGTAPVDPRDPVQRYGAGVLEAAPSIALGRPSTLGETISQTAGTITGPIASQVAQDNGAGPAGQVLAGVAAGAAPGLLGGLPAVAARGVAGRGGRADIEALRNLQNAETAGITNPRYGQVSGRTMPTSLEAFFTKFPTSAGVMARNAAQQAEQASGTVNGIVDNLTSRAPNARGAGLAIDRGVTDSFMDRTGEVRQRLYTKLDNLIPGDTKVDVAPYQDMLASITAPIKGAKAQSSVIQNQTNGSFMTTLNAALKHDLKLANLPEGAEAVTMPAQDYWTDGTQRIAPADAAKAGLDPSKLPGWKHVQTDETPGWNVPGEKGPTFIAEKDLEPGTQLPYKAIKELRTQVGAMLNDSLLNGKGDANLSRLYGSLTKVMEGAAAAQGPQAQAAFSRANKYYTALKGRLDTLQRIVDAKGGPEGIYNAAMAGTKDGASTLHKVMQSLPEESRNVLIANVLQKMGKAAPGVQNAAGDAWSFQTFLTNYNRMSPAARAEMFGRLPGDYKTSLDALVKFAAQSRQAGSMYANPSGTAHSAALIHTMSGAAAGTLGAMHHPIEAAGTLLITALPNVGARILTKPRFVKWLANSYKMPVSATPALIAQLAQQAKDTGDTDLGQLATSIAQKYQERKANNQFMQQQSELEQQVAAQAAQKDEAP